ncbi:MAG: hypothetical protein NT113_11835 [Hyphomicrobiales bacterium]|nr:hypothetical protein [Hyphomicrobiales bacterium]
MSLFLPDVRLLRASLSHCRVVAVCRPAGILCGRNRVGNTSLPVGVFATARIQWENYERVRNMGSRTAEKR